MYQLIDVLSAPPEGYTHCVLGHVEQATRSEMQTVDFSSSERSGIDGSNVAGMARRSPKRSDEDFVVSI